MRRDMDGQLVHFGSDHGDRELIGVYSRVFGTQFLFEERDGSTSCHIRARLTGEPKVISLYSDAEKQGGGFYDTASVMLARFCYRRYF